MTAEQGLTGNLLDILWKGDSRQVEPTLAVQTRPPVDMERRHADNVVKKGVTRHSVNAHRDLLQKQKQKLSCLTGRERNAHLPPSTGEAYGDSRSQKTDCRNEKGRGW